MRSGLNFPEIARQLNYKDRGSAYKACMAALKSQVMEDAEEVRSLEVSRCDEMLQAIWPTVTAPLLLAGEDENEVPSKTLVARLTKQHEAMDRALRIMERRSKYLGLDSPVKTEVSGQITVTDDQFTQALTEWALDPEKIAEYQREKDAQQQVSG
jgi:hypothetical protein